MIRTYSILLMLLIANSVAITQTWEAATPPPNFLTDHSFGFALNGKGYLVAGTTEFNGPTNTFLQYDPETDKWTELDTFPGLGRGYAIGDVWDGKAYMGFGTTNESILNDLWVFDPDSMKWTALDTCPCEPRLHPAFVAHNGKIFAGLGNGNSGNHNDWYEYDIASNEWSRKTDFPDVPRHHPYQFAVGDYVYTGFGHGPAIYKEWYRYDPVSEVWDQMADLPAEGRVAGTQFSFGDKGYVLSGDGEDHSSMEEGEFWEYDPLMNAWTQLPPHPGKSRWAPASFIIDGILYLFNGTSFFNAQGYIYMESAYKFDLNSLISSTNDVEGANIQISPNPASDEMEIILSSESSFQKWNLVDTYGRVLNEGKFIQLNTSINISALPDGMYFLVGDHFSEKIIVCH